MWFSFAGECEAPVVNHSFNTATPFHVTTCLVLPPGDRVWRWVRFSPEDPTTKNPKRWSYLRMPRFQLCGRDHGLHQTQCAPRLARKNLVIKTILQWMWQGFLLVIQPLQRNYVPAAQSAEIAPKLSAFCHIQHKCLQFRFWLDKMNPMLATARLHWEILLALARVH